MLLQEFDGLGSVSRIVHHIPAALDDLLQQSPDSWLVVDHKDSTNPLLELGRHAFDACKLCAAWRRGGDVKGKGLKGDATTGGALLTMIGGPVKC